MGRHASFLDANIIVSGEEVVLVISSLVDDNSDVNDDAPITEPAANEADAGSDVDVDVDVGVGRLDA